jgi:hypothetical protein
MQKLLLTFLVTGLAVLSFGAKAQDAAVVENTLFAPAIEETATPAAAEAEEEESKGITISGFVDGYYMYNFNKTGFPTSFTEAHNSFALGMANVVFAKEGKVGFVADLAVGPRAEVANGYSGSTLSAIKQLFVTYSPSDAVKFTFGNFGTFVGYELIDAPANVNYSMSYMFSNGPFYHTGLKADFALGESFGAMVGIFNDTDRKIDEVAGKHIGLQLSTTQGALTSYLNFLYGIEAEGGDGVKDVTGFQVDLTTTYEVSEKLLLGLNVTNKTSTNGDDSSGFLGAAAYLKVGLTEKVALGLRGEYFGRTDGIDTTDDDSVLAFTLSGNIMLGEGLTLIPEFRFDKGNSDAVFFNSEGAPKGSTGGFILAAVYAF